MELKSPSTGVFTFLRTRRKWYRRAGESKKAALRLTSQRSNSRLPAIPAVAATRSGRNNSESPRPKLFNYTYSNRYNLTRLTQEQIVAPEKERAQEEKRQS